jgi:uncharacterized RDD family membrane protein YckC
MTCPSCGGELVSGADRCPVCDAVLAPRTEGALAADPRLVTPPARGRAKAEAALPKPEPIREIPGLRRREPRDPSAARPAERSWRDEVQARIRSRRQKRSEAGLPLFDQPAVQARPGSPDDTLPPPEPPAPTRAETVTRPVAPSRVARTLPAEPAPAPAPDDTVAPGDVAPPPASAAREADRFTPGLSEAELADLPLRAPAAAEGHPRPEPAARVPSRPAPPPLEDDALLDEVEFEPGIDLAPPSAEPAPLERPARAGERTQAAAFDLALFVTIATVVVYFASRAARVDLPQLLAAWPWLAGFLGLLAVFYACYFTGTTGQTPGKLLLGLHVVDAAGRPPRYPRATARAVVGLLGIALAGLGLAPIAFDPAGRALHDRMFRTRVVRR